MVSPYGPLAYSWMDHRELLGFLSSPELPLLHRSLHA